MKRAPWLRLAWRELRGSGGKLVLPATCIALAVAGQSTVRHFAGRVDRALDVEAREIAGADFEVNSPRALSSSVLDAAKSALPSAMRHTVVKEFISMARAVKNGQTRLVEVRSVGKDFPYYGELEIEPKLAMAALATPVKPSEPAPAFAQPELLPQLGIQVGDLFSLGKREYRLVAIVRREPGPGGSAFALGPRIWISEDTLASTQLEQTGSRIRYRNLFAYPASESHTEPTEAKLTEGKTALEAAVADPTIKIRTFKESSPQLRTFFDKLGNFLKVLSLFVFLLAGVGVMSAIRAHLRTRLQVVAILRCLGASRRQVLGLFLTQAALLGFVGSLAGALLGILTAGFLPRLIGDLITLPAGEASYAGFAISIAMGIGVTLLFAFLALVELPSLKPILLLRPGEAARAPAGPRVFAGSLIVIAFYAVAYFETKSAAFAAWIVGGTGAFFALSFTFFYALLSITRRLRTRHGGSSLVFAWRYGFRNLGRTRARSALTLAVLGTATLLLASVSILRHGMLEELGTARHEARPQLFMIDIGDEQKPMIEKTLGEIGRFQLVWSRLIRARLTTVNGEAVKRSEKDDGMNRSREMNLSERLSLYPTESVIDGKFWTQPWRAGRDGEDAEVSVVEGFAESAGIKVGDRLEFEIQGVTLYARVSNLRRVKWTTFQPNFFILFRPGALDGAPFQWITSVSGAEGDLKSQVQNRVARDFSTVTVIDIDEASGRLLVISERLEAVVRFLSLFTLLAGLAVLAAMALENASARAGEIALLKTLGAGRRELLSAITAEYLAIGLLASGVGSIGAWVLAEVALSKRFGITPELFTFETLGLLGALAAVVLITGVIASARIFAIKPSLILKAE